MDDLTSEEMIEMIDEMQEGDLQEVCDEVGLEWNMLDEAGMRQLLRAHYMYGGVDADKPGPEAAVAPSADDAELAEYRELIEMMEYDDTVVALGEEGVAIQEDTLEWMKCALFSQMAGLPIPGPGASWDDGGGGGGDDYTYEDADEADEVDASKGRPALLQPAGTVVFSGYLSVVGAGAFHSKKKPKRRYFEMTPTHLEYYESEGGKCLRSIDMRTAVAISAKVSMAKKDGDTDACAVKLFTPLRTWELLADDQRQAAKWIQAGKKQLDVIEAAMAEDADLDMDDDDVISSAFATFEKYATPGPTGDELLTRENVDDMLREEIGFDMNQEYVDTVYDKYENGSQTGLDVDEFLGVYKFMWLVQ